MKIIRNGIEFELTKEEMQKAKDEIELEFVKSIIGDGSEWKIDRERIDEFYEYILADFQTFNEEENQRYVEYLAYNLADEWQDEELSEEEDE